VLRLEGHLAPHTTLVPHVGTKRLYCASLMQLFPHNPTLSQPDHSNRLKSCPAWCGVILQICTFAHSCNLQHCKFINLHASAIHVRRDRMHISCVALLQQFEHVLQICTLGCACATCRCARLCTCKSQLANLQACRNGHLQICTLAGQHVQCKGTEHSQIMHFRGNIVFTNLRPCNCAGL
jgi:hypothetical protein